MAEEFGGRFWFDAEFGLEGLAAEFVLIESEMALAGCKVDRDQAATGVFIGVFIGGSEGEESFEGFFGQSGLTGLLLSGRETVKDTLEKGAQLFAADGCLVFVSIFFQKVASIESSGGRE